MTRRVFTVLALILAVALGCSLSVKPATAARPVAAGSMERAMRAAVAAASASNWVTKTVSPETGYILAEREERVTGRRDRPEAYKLGGTIQSDGPGSISVNVH